jgi:hypothetical protein
MRDHGAAEEIRVFVTDQEPAPAYELGQRIFGELAQGHPATAVYATSDTTAIGVIQAAFQPASPSRPPVHGWLRRHRHGALYHPISQTGVDMGRVAAELLSGMIDDNLNASAR